VSKKKEGNPRNEKTTPTRTVKERHADKKDKRINNNKQG
jgi:hypothetical protein